MRAAILASVSLVSSMYFSSVMALLCAYFTVFVKLFVQYMNAAVQNHRLDSVMPRVTPLKQPLRPTFLRRWREYNKLSQDDAAALIGIDRSLLSKVENGKAPYNQAFLEAAAYAYKCEPVELLIRDPFLANALWALINAIRKAPESKQQQIAEIVETLLKSLS